ncbi:hypothetical protein MSTHT_1873 [Methanosarcina thermophila TM-1]|uniref:Uncharacterized protein n=1 Tax=Methanosarcina thermophila (strain ATCC 43570 / DSM 1825 / OCM 12 / VKM B-1830 / TM-1) TaxID=523844 RepID=A0A0E3KQ05_METTT|nr:hypothetical protein MSTHT_1873 [Methanosarcina thermophila TM-1]
MPASETSQEASASAEPDGLYRIPKIPTSIKRKPRRRTAGLEALILEEALYLLAFFPESCLLKGTLPKKFQLRPDAVYST